MKKQLKFFADIQKECEWLSKQKGWKLVEKRGLCYTLEESTIRYQYEYIFFETNHKELEQIKDQIEDEEIEFVCSTISWALFRKEADKGEIQVLSDRKVKYDILIKKYHIYFAMGACYLCLGFAQISMFRMLDKYFLLTTVIFMICGIFFLSKALIFKRYAEKYGKRA